MYLYVAPVSTSLTIFWELVILKLLKDGPGDKPEPHCLYILFGIIILLSKIYYNYFHACVIKKFVVEFWVGPLLASLTIADGQLLRFVGHFRSLMVILVIGSASQIKKFA